MSEISRGFDVSAEQKKVGPDYFGFYASEVAALLCQQEDFLPFSPQASDAGTRNEVVDGKIIEKDNNNIKENNDKSGSAVLFSDCLETWIPELVKERLKSLLRQSVVALSQEVDEMLDPVFSMCRIQVARRFKGSLPNITNTACETEIDQPPLKKIRPSMSSSDTETKKMDMSLPGKEMPEAVVKKCKFCSATRSESPCHACGNPLEQERESPLVTSGVGAEKKNGDGNDDLLFLLENDSSEVEDILKKYSDELLTTIKHMETMLDKLLDVVMSNCRPMSRIEKQELKKLIQNLPGRNLDRVVEIVQCSRSVGKISSDEVQIDLEKEDKVTLWRLYYYVQTVESARNSTELTDK